MLAHQPILSHRTRGKQGNEHQRTRRTRRLRVQRGNLLHTHPAKSTRNHPMQLRPKRLGVREGGVNARDERGAPQIYGRPTVGQELGGGSQRERGRVEEGNEVREEEAAVGDDLALRGWEGKGQGEGARRSASEQGTGTEQARRTNEVSKSAQGDSDTARAGLWRTTGGTSVQRSTARLCPSRNVRGSSVCGPIEGTAGSQSTRAWTRMHRIGPTPEVMKDGGMPRKGAARWSGRCQMGDR